MACAVLAAALAVVRFGGAPSTAAGAEEPVTFNVVNHQLAPLTRPDETTYEPAAGAPRPAISARRSIQFDHAALEQAAVGGKTP